ncbi:kinase-like protein [Exidia glandulosa HHB12029]|uniref:Kinase-like protein n=1 Tax=Exidia glandulosa HHB12029 TaxID=1314781 RepID=A0A165PUQ4_EXIGL|nr:kinase-like protein [Exidia glandulosa HHB12029]
MSTGTTDSGVSVDWHLNLSPDRHNQHANSLLFATFTPESHTHSRSISSPPSLSSPCPSPDHHARRRDSELTDSPVPPPARAMADDEGVVKMATAAPRPVSLTYGISAVGRGFDWKWNDRETPREESPEPVSVQEVTSPSWSLGYSGSVLSPRPQSATPPVVTPPPTEADEPAKIEPLTDSPPALHDEPVPFPSSADGADDQPSHPPSQRGSRPSSPRPRRRDSQKRISLVAGRLSMISFQPPPSPPPQVPQTLLSPRLNRFGSNSSALSIVSTAPPKSTDGSGSSTSSTGDTFRGGRSIDDFVIDGEAGRGAYGVVKRARERLPDGSLGEPLILKQVVKSRILADCWKKHPRLGTIPIEIYVMSAISNTPYTLPCPRRPWDPLRSFVTGVDPPPRISGDVVLGHPGICKLIDFWEDAHFYYLMMPNARPSVPLPTKDAPGDLFDLVERYPQGLPPSLVRSYLGQLADAMAFLHAKGIVHRDIKDENVVLGEPDGVCVLIDFGSSGVVRRAGWDTFNGTLDYAAPEILEGARYMGKEQDIWAFGVVAFVLLVGECPFASKAEAHWGLGPPSIFPAPGADADGQDASGSDPLAAFLDGPPPRSTTTTKAGRALDARCLSRDETSGSERAFEGLEPDGGGALGDAAALVRACLQLDPKDRPSFEDVMRSRFLCGSGGWGDEWVPGWVDDVAGSGGGDVLLSPTLVSP